MQSVNESIALARGGNQQDVGNLLDQCYDYLLAIANQEMESQVRPKIGASDVVQETMALAHQHFAEFRGDSERQLLGWLRQILLNQLRDANRHFRAAKRNIDREQTIHGDSQVQRNPTDVADEQITPRSDALAQEQTKAIQQALAKLPDDYRVAIEARCWDRLSFAEIGDRLNRSEDAARKLWYRAVEKLQDELDELK